MILIPKISKETKEDCRKIIAIVCDIVIAICLINILLTLIFEAGAAILILVIVLFLRGQIGELFHYPYFSENDENE